MNRSTPPTTTASSSQGMDSQNSSCSDLQIQMVQKFSEQSGMNMEYSKLLVLNILSLLKYFYFFFIFKNLAV